MQHLRSCASGKNPSPVRSDRPAGFGWDYAGPSGKQHGDAIVTTVFTFLCCNLLALPFGIVAIVKASGVNDKALRGDFAGAQADGESAKKFSLIALVVWLVTTALWFVLNFMLGFGHALWSR